MKVPFGRRDTEISCPFSETCFPPSYVIVSPRPSCILDVSGATMLPAESTNQLEAPSIRPLVSAAEYVRMSTDRHGLRIEKTYEDSGKSGLNLDDRDALKS